MKEARQCVMLVLMAQKLTGFEKWWLDSWFHRWHVRRFVPRFLRACPEPFRGEVLEAGAGGGWTSRRILDIFPQVELTAFDVDDGHREVFEKLRETYGKRLKFEQADLNRLPFDRESFDITVAIHVLHHVENPEQAVRQLIRVTRPGGLIGIAGENTTSWRRIIGQASNQWLGSAQEAIERIMQEESCEVVVSEGEIHYVIWAKKPYPINPGGA